MLLTPNSHAIAVMVLTVVALYLFSRPSIPLETTSLAVLLALVLGFHFFPYTSSAGTLRPTGFFYGFGHQALIAVSALMACGHALVRTGALEPVGRSLTRLWRRWPKLSMLLTLLVGAILSAFVNNTPIVVLMLPVLVNVSLRTKTSVSGSLLPMGLATLVGGMSTTIGTSTNLLVVSVAKDMGVREFGMFDFALPAVIAGSVAIVYLWLVAPRLLPERTPPMSDSSPRLFTAQLLVKPRSAAAGKRLSAVLEMSHGEMSVTRILRGKLSLATLPDVQVKAGDMLVVSDTASQLREFADVLGAALYSGERALDPAESPDPGDQNIAEIAVMPGSPIEGVRLSEVGLSRHYGLTLLAYHRSGEVAQAKSKALQQRVVKAGDVFLVQGQSSKIAQIKRQGDLLVLDGSAELPRTSKAPLALAIMAMVVVSAASGALPIAFSALAGVLVLLLTRCLDWRDLSHALSAQVILLIAASLALGMALMSTGAADFIAQSFIFISAGSSPAVILAGLMLFMAFLTNVVSNNAAAVIGTPISISIATQLGLPVEPFVLAVLFGANMSYATPMAYQTNLLVMNAGGYEFKDFLRVGIPLTLLIWLVLVFVLTAQYQL